MIMVDQPTSNSPTDGHAGPYASGPTPFSGSPISRRSLLGALSAVALGAATGCSLTGSDSQDFGSSGGGGLPGAGKAGAGPATAYRPQQPYVLQAACELTEDYFLVGNRAIDPARDTVVAYSRADGEVEAVVLQDGIIRQFFRDASQPGGWGSVALDNATNVRAMAAAVSGAAAGSGSPGQLKIFYTRGPDNAQSTDGNLYIAHEVTPAPPGGVPTFTTATVAWSPQAVDLQLSVNFDASLLVSAMQHSSIAKGVTQTDARLYFYTDGRFGVPAAQNDTYGYLTGFPFLDVNNEFTNDVGSAPRPRWSAVIAKPWAISEPPAGVNAANLMFFQPFDTYPGVKTDAVPSVNIWSWPVKPGQKVAATAINWAVQADRPSQCPRGIPETLSIDTATTLGGRNTPTLLVRTLEEPSSGAEQHLWIVSHDPTQALRYPNPKPDAAWSWTELTLPAVPTKDTPMVFSTGLRPLPTSEEVKEADLVPSSMLDVFVVSDNVLSVIRQAPTLSAFTDYTHPVYCPAITLERDVVLMSSQGGQSNGNELLVVGTDRTLQTLVKDPTTGVWSDTAVRLPAAELQELDSYHVQITLTDTTGYPLGGSAVEVTASTSVPVLSEGADGISTSTTLGQTPTTFTTDPTGGILLALVAEGVAAPTLTMKAVDGGTSLAICPSVAVNAYLQGGSTLNYLDPVDQDGTLAAARTPSKTQVFPRATDKAVTGDTLDMITKAAQKATASGVVAATRSTSLVRRDGTLSSSGSRAAELKGVISDIDHWSHDALHAIKKGAAKIKSVTYDAEHNVFQLAGDFEGWAEKVVSVVVKGLEDAAHVIHAAFNKLGAWIRDAVHWLAAEVVGTLQDTFALAEKYEKWLTGSSGPNGLFPALVDQIGRAKSSADNWLTAQEQRIRDDFDAWRAAVDPRSTLQSLAAQQSSVGRSQRRSRASGASVERSGSHHGMWLYNFSHWKLNPKAEMSLGGITTTQVADLRKALLDAVASASQEAQQGVEGLVTFWTKAVKHPRDIPGLAEKALLDTVEGLVDWVFHLVKATTDAFLDLAATVVQSFSNILFETPLVPLPGLQKLFELLNITEPSLGRFVLAVLAFPAVVTYKIKHHGAGYPFGPASGTDARLSLEGDVESALLEAAAGVSFIWAVIDAESALYAAVKQEPPRFLACMDIAIPLILTVLTTPDTDDQEPFVLPPWDDEHVWGYLAWALGVGDAVIAAIDLYADIKLGEAEAAETADALLWQEVVVGALCLVFSCVQIENDKHDRGFSYAEAVLDNLPLLASPLLLGRFVLSSEGVTAGVNAAVVAGAGIVNGILFAREDS